MSPISRGPFHYWLAVILLTAAAAAMQVAKDYKILTVIKKPLPLRVPLNDLDRAALAPFRFEASRSMSHDIVQELGTDQYIYWILSDPEARRGKDGRVSVFVTYYTDIQDQVPHVPEECYFQGAFTPGDNDTLTMRLDKLEREIQIRRLSFYAPKQTSKQSVVYYTICVNGDFYASRTPVRFRMGDRKETHLYYSKIEICFQGKRNQDVANLDERARLVMDRVIAELVNTHWPLKGSELGGNHTAPERE